MMIIVRALFFHAPSLSLNIMSYLLGKQNINEDLLSRFQVEAFRRPTVLSEGWDPPGGI